jgi:membrane protease YdiL (CAAX protease family)
MLRAIGLYLVGFLILAVSALQPSTGWLAPIGLAVLFFGSILLWRADGRKFQDLGYRRITHWVRNLVGGFFIGAVIPLVVYLLMWVAGWAEISVHLQLQTVGVFTTGILIALVRAGLISFAEELVFRGYFYRTFGLRSGIKIAVFVSSVLWALTHLPDMVAAGLSPISILIGMVSFILWGVFLALAVRLGDDSLWIPFGVHFGINFVFSSIGYFLVTKPLASQWIIGHPAWSPESGLLGFLIWGAVLLVALAINSGINSSGDTIPDIGSR